MPAVTAREMIVAARRATATESLDPSNAFVTDDELLEVLNGELAEVHDTIVENHDDAFFKAIQPIDLESGSETYPLPLSVLRITSVDIIWSADIRRTAKHFTEAERNRFRTVRPAWGQFCDVFFRPDGDNIVFLPVPMAAVSVSVNYIPQFTPLLALTDTFNVPNDWHRMAIWGVVMYIRQKDSDEINAAIAEGQKAKQKARIVTMAATRVEGDAPRVQRTRRYDDEELL